MSMNSPKEIKDRISSVSNTKKITRTMELVSTAKSRQSLYKLESLSDYMNVLESSISVALLELEREKELEYKDIDLLRKANMSAPCQYLVITSNRGLCGSFNNNILSFLNEELKKNTDSLSYEVDFIGNKGVKQFTFSGGNPRHFWSDIDDKFTYQNIKELASEYTKRYIKGEISSLKIIYTHYYSGGRQNPNLFSLLPLIFKKEKDEATRENRLFILEPNPRILIKELLPRWISVSLDNCMLSSVTSEHIARRVAMKNATDAAADMVKELTLFYNRSRQAKITQEIAEIVGGAVAVF